MSDNLGILDPAGINLNPLTNEQYSETYRELAKKWSRFPAYEKAHDIINSIKSNQVILITSGTGSGKTVLLPKFVLHTLGYNGKVAITLPKQMITQSSAEFAAKTLDVKLGKEVGYKFKGSDKKSMSDKTKLLFATDGTIVSKLMTDPELKEFDAVIVDEAHERKVQIDFLLYLLKQTCKSRPNFKLVIMSATVNEKIFSDYFTEFKFCHYDVGGKTNYPIESIFLNESVKADEKSYLQTGIDIANNIIQTTKEGDILFFVTSIQETLDTCKKLVNTTNDDKIFCIEVYAGMNEEKQEIAQSENTTNKRKLIIATNVAESSLTISNIKFVIDSGYELFSYYDPESNSKVLTKKLITHAQAKQRMGRAGRTGPGVCFHLYTKKMFEQLEPFPLPTIKTSDITGECLKLLSLESIQHVDKLKEILSDFIEPPNEKYINKSIMTLKQLGLIENDSINNLGKIISDLQVDPMQGLAMLNAYKVNCVKETIAIFAIIDACKGNINELFHVPKSMIDNESQNFDNMTKKFMKAKNKLTSKSMGDHLTLLKIFTTYKKIKTDSNKSNNKTKLTDWLYLNFLKGSVLDKADKYYKKIKQTVIQKIQNYLSVTLSENKETISKLINSHRLGTRILSSIMSGFFLNTMFIKQSNKSKSNKSQQHIKLSKDSFLNMTSDDIDDHTELLYNSMTTINNNVSISIVSPITKSIKTISTNLTNL